MTSPFMQKDTLTRYRDAIEASRMFRKGDSIIMKAINAAKAPAAVGPYVHAIQAGNTIYTSGQLGLIPETGELAVGVEAQAEQAIKNLEVVLKEAGCTLKNVVKTTVFLADINDFAKINAIYAKYFDEHKPARSCVQAGALPKGGLFEMEVIAVKE